MKLQAFRRAMAGWHPAAWFAFREKYGLVYQPIVWVGPASWLLLYIEVRYVTIPWSTLAILPWIGGALLTRLGWRVYRTHFGWFGAWLHNSLLAGVLSFLFYGSNDWASAAQPITVLVPIEKTVLRQSTGKRNQHLYPVVSVRIDEQLHALPFAAGKKRRSFPHNSSKSLGKRASGATRFCWATGCQLRKSATPPPTACGKFR